MVSQRGYTYLLVLFLVAGLGLVMAGVGQSWQARAHRDKEAELIAVGVEMARALGHYHEHSPGAAKQWPRSLNDLIEDRRFPTPQRHLRRIYRDPFTGEPDWALVRQGDVIIGFHSVSERAPMRSNELPPELGESAAEAKQYQDWLFKPVLEGGDDPKKKADDAGETIRPSTMPRTLGSRSSLPSAAEQE